MYKLIFIIFAWLCIFTPTYAATVIQVDQTQSNLRNIEVRDTGGTNGMLENFVAPFSDFFFTTDAKGGEGAFNAFVMIAFQIKNFFIMIAVIFLIIAVIKLLFSPADDESVKKWKNNIIWISVGVFVMQIAFSVWNAFIIKDATTPIGSAFGWQIWSHVLQPIVNLLQMLASFGFIFMMVYAFFSRVTSGGDEEKTKKANSTIIYALMGFVLIGIPKALVSMIYGTPSCKEGTLIEIGSCEIKNQNLSGSIEIVAKIVNYFSGFLSIVCVVLVIYAGWLVFMSAGDEEKIKKAKNIIIYVIIGLLILVASSAIFKFFILNG